MTRVGGHAKELPHFDDGTVALNCHTPVIFLSHSVTFTVSRHTLCNALSRSILHSMPASQGTLVVIDLKETIDMGSNNIRLL